jgi:hypothetical protein
MSASCQLCTACQSGATYVLCVSEMPVVHSHTLVGLIYRVNADLLYETAVGHEMLMQLSTVVTLYVKFYVDYICRRLVKSCYSVLCGASCAGSRGVVHIESSSTLFCGVYAAVPSLF